MNDILEQIKPKKKKIKQEIPVSNKISNIDVKIGDSSPLNIPEEKYTSVEEDSEIKTETDEKIEELYNEFLPDYPAWVTCIGCSTAFGMYEMAEVKLVNYNDIMFKHMMIGFNDFMSFDDKDMNEVKAKDGINADPIMVHKNNTIPLILESIIPLYQIDPYNINVIDVDGVSRPLKWNFTYSKGIDYLVKKLDKVGNCDICPFKIGCERRQKFQEERG